MKMPGPVNLGAGNFAEPFRSLLHEHSVIENACRIQIDAMSGGARLQPLSEATRARTVDQGRRMYGKGGFIEVGREWPALVRQLERLDGTGYKD